MLTSNGTTARAVEGESSSILVEIVERLARIEQLMSYARRADGSVDDFADIDPERFYTIPELVKIPGRPVSKQALYEALNAGRLKEHLAGGPRGCLGRAYIAWLKSRRPAQSRRGRPSKMLTPTRAR